MSRGYERDPIQGPSKYLKLKDKGDKVKVRLLCEPYREPRVWDELNKKFYERDQIVAMSKSEWVDVMRTPDFTVNEVFYWIVIDRADNKTKLFGATGGVYKKIKKFATTDEWGDPTTYDFVIERTEQPGNSYYQVDPLPNKSRLTEEDLGRLGEIDIAKEVPSARLNSAEQLDDISEEMEAHRSQQSSSAGPEKTAEERHREIMNDPGRPQTEPSKAPRAPDPDPYEDAPINLDDIPF
jgi:hypothetical protein